MNEAEGRSAALIPAAGVGQRLGRGPKAFLRLGGRTLLEHAVSRLRHLVDEVWVALPEPASELSGDAAHALPEGVRWRRGGESRQESVRLLLETCEAPWLLVHDAARPLAPSALAERVLRAARASGAASAALPVRDTLHDVARDAPVAREQLRAIQTPQAFRRDWLLEAHARAHRERWTATDDAQLLRRCGRAVALVEGSPFAHKLTGPEDLSLLTQLERGARAEPAA